MRILIPSSVAAEVAHALSNYHTHATLENCFQRAGVGDDPPVGNKLQKTGDYLRRVNEDEMLEPLAVLGLILEEFMTKRVFYEEPESTQIARARVEKALADHPVGATRWRIKGFRGFSRSSTTERETPEKSQNDPQSHPPNGNEMEMVFGGAGDT